MSANTRQIAGNHYIKYGEFQVWDAWWHWNLDAFEANIIKYVMRTKGGFDKRLEDLDKADHYLQKYKELLQTQLEQQEEQFEAATWELCELQEKIVKEVAYGSITAKLEALDRAEYSLRAYREQLVAGTVEEQLLNEELQPTQSWPR